MSKEIIPRIESIWKECSTNELRANVLEYFRNNLKDITVKNKDTGINITITMKSGRKTAKGEAMYHGKAEIIRVLPEIIENAQYNNFGNRKKNDPALLLAYMNLKGKCILDGKLLNLRISIQCYRGPKYYYNIEVNRKN